MSAVRWTEKAAADLLAIGDYLGADRPGAARAWVERLRACGARAGENPRSGRIVPEIGREDVREVFLRSYRIVYRVTLKGIVVLTVFEGHRLLGGIEPDTAG